MEESKGRSYQNDIDRAGVVNKGEPKKRGYFINGRTFRKARKKRSSMSKASRKRNR